VYPASALAGALADALTDALLDGLVDALEDVLAEPLALAVEFAEGTLGVPTLTRRIIGVPNVTEAPAPGIVPMMVFGLSWLRSSRMMATSSPASVRI
jgi:hypothetical protein